MINPKVFAIIPTYKHEQWLEECMKGFAQQTIRPNVLCIIDDGSPDGTWPLLSSLCTNLQNLEVSGSTEPEKLVTGVYDGIPCLLVKFSKNYGPSVSRNYAIKSLESPEDTLLAFCDSDDIYEPTKIEESIPYFLENPHCGLVYSDYTTVNAEGHCQRQFKLPYSKMVLSRECTPNMDSIFKAKVFKDCGGFDESLRTVEDFDRYLAISNKYIISHIAHSLIRIRVGLHSSTSTISKQQWEQNYRRVMQKHFGGK